MSSPTNFGAFLSKMATLDYLDILLEANVECTRAEFAADSGRLDTVQYTQRIKQFLFFVRYWDRPVGITDDDFAAYRPVVEALVAKGNVKAAEVLKLFS
jgi:hypothetical protein